MLAKVNGKEYLMVSTDSPEYDIVKAVIASKPRFIKSDEDVTILLEEHEVNCICDLKEGVSFVIDLGNTVDLDGGNVLTLSSNICLKVNIIRENLIKENNNV